jgi:hypothetical protein
MKIDFVLNRNDWIAYYSHFQEKNAQNSPPVPIALQIIVNYLVVVAIVIIVSLAIFYALKLIGLATGYPIEKWFPWLPSPLPALVALVVIAAPITWALLGSQKFKGTIKDQQKSKIAAQVDSAISARTINIGYHFELELRSDGLVQKSWSRESRSGVDYSHALDMVVPWTSIHSMEFTESHGFILINEGYQIIIPKRSFATEESFSEFIATIKQHYETGSGSGTKHVGPELLEESQAIQKRNKWHN